MKHAFVLDLMMVPPFPAVPGLLDGEMVYILHFKQPLAHAGHYIGYTRNLEHRLELHRAGTSGARLMQACKAQGIDWELAGVIPGDRRLERSLKNRHRIRAICPICRAEYLAARRERYAEKAKHGDPC